MNSVNVICYSKQERKIPMRFFKLALSVLTLTILASCGAPTAINPENGKETAEFLKDQLKRDIELTVTQEEYGDGIHDLYELGPDVRVVMDDEQGVDQIEFHQLNEQEVLDTLAMIDFPESTSIDRALTEEGKNNILNLKPYFTEYKGTGVFIMGDFSATEDTPNPYRLILMYDEENFDAHEDMDVD